METMDTHKETAENQQVDSTVVQMWPFYELHGLWAQLAILNCLQNTLTSSDDERSGDLDERLKACLEFVNQCGISDALSVVPWSSMSESQYEVCSLLGLNCLINVNFQTKDFHIK